MVEWLSTVFKFAADIMASAAGFISDNITIFLIFAAIIASAVILGASNTPCKTGGARGKNPKKVSRDRVKDLSKHPRTKSEALAIDILEKLVGKPFPTVNPDWLRVKENGISHTIELDGYNEEAGIALEFSGPLHTKWTPSVETYASYLRRIKLDQAKIDLCGKRGVCLIVIDMALPRVHWRDYIASRLQDCNKLPADKVIYFRYIPAQVAVPYRDDILEKDVQLDISW